MKRFFCTLAAALTIVCSPTASSSTKTTEITDMWWIPAESGWGVNVILQNGTAFLTFFVYDEGNFPFWYVASVNYQGPSGSSLLWTGDLYATIGPWFGVPWNPAVYEPRLVGTATFRLDTINQATLTYTVDGLTVTKIVERQTWKTEDYTAIYGGGYSVRASACMPASMNGVQELFGLISITQAGSSFSATVSGPPTCTFTGIYSQMGKLGAVAGSYNCSDGILGTFNLLELTPTIRGFNGHLTATNQFCQWTGNFGGVTRTP